MMRLPGEQAPEFIQMLPFTPARKDNLASWMVARSDGEHYGRLGVFQFPKQKVVFGPRQIVARINQDQAIAPQITLWNQQGSEVLQGTLLVIPIEESLLYIRPLYLRSAGGRIPELKRVIVAHQNQIVMEETLDEALDRLFPSGAARATLPAAPAGKSRTPERRRRGAGQPARCARRCERASITSARSRRSGMATGRSTARRSAGSARCWIRCAERPEDLQEIAKAAGGLSGGGRLTTAALFSFVGNASRREEPRRNTPGDAKSAKRLGCTRTGCIAPPIRFAVTSVVSKARLLQRSTRSKRDQRICCGRSPAQRGPLREPPRRHSTGSRGTRRRQVKLSLTRASG